MVVDLDKLKQYWEYITLVLGLVVALTYFVLENKQANTTIQELSEANKVLTEKVQKLEGHTEGFDHAIQIFMEHPPGIIEYRVGMLETKVFGSTNQPNQPAPAAVTKQIIPPSVNN
jgi:hypothetical protein